MRVRTDRSNPLRVVRSHDPHALLEAAADGFLSLDRGGDLFGSPSYLLALRQGGLRDDLIALAAARGVPGWFDPPLCLFQQLDEWLGTTGLAMTGDYERVVLLSGLLRDSSPAVFGRLARPDAFINAVDRMFGQLVAEAVSPDVFKAALESRTDRDGFERNRDGDLAASYRAYIEMLAQAGRRDGRDRMIDAARALAADPDGFAKRLGGRRELRIFGLQDMRGGWRVLLPALLASPALDEVVIYSTTAIETLLGREPDSVDWIGARDAFVSKLFLEGDDASPSSIPMALMSAPDVDRETEEVAHRVRALIDSGVAPSSIAVISRSARPYVDRVLDAFALYGVPATARQRHAFAEIPVVRAVLALFSVAAEGWTRHGLVELAEQPYFGRMTAENTGLHRLDPVIINHIGYRRRVQGLDEWIAAHRALHDAARLHEDRATAADEEPRRGRDTPPPAYRCRNALASFTSFADMAGDLDTPRPLRAWVEWLRRFLDDDPWRIESRLYGVPAARYDVARIDAAGMRGMRRIVTEWSDALTAWSDEDDEIGVVAFESMLREMLSGDAALWTPARRGVQILEGMAASQRSFDHVFIVGLSDGTFPLRAPRSPLFNEHERSRLALVGVPMETRADWESRERTLFGVLIGAARRSLTLSWPRANGAGRDLMPSAFVEEVVIASGGTVELPESGDDDFIATSRVASPSLPLLRSAAQRELAAHAASIERIRRMGTPSPFNGVIEDPALLEWLKTDRLGEEYVWSATQLEQYAKCPWAWFSQRLLRLDDLDDPDIDMDPLMRGTVLHEALRHFYDAAAARAGRPVFLRNADLDWVRDMVPGALEQAITVAGTTSWLGAPALRETKKAELLRMLVGYLEWEIEHNEKQHTGGWQKKRILRTAVDEHELAFGSMPGSPTPDDDEILELGGVTFRMRGSIDRVEVGIDERLGEDPANFVAAVDYKSGKYSTPGSGKKEAWNDGVVLQVPLYAHILARRRPGTRVSRVEYRAIRHRETVHSTELFQVRNEGLTRQDEMCAQMDLALEAAGAHVARARSGTFPAEPAASCGCPPYCHAWDICRIDGGPRPLW
ncbi:MAG TPA: PD-(D/E)XK nuclease family protein [Longimicrobiales bacterium]|nr:PD-(D/E)XK nuclease family protein [Longimicrobiales bacterium]